MTATHTLAEPGPDGRCRTCGDETYMTWTADGTRPAHTTTKMLFCSTSRTYVIGLPVVMTVYADGRVRADVDLSEADDLFDSSVATPEGQDDSEDTVIADKEAISAAVTARTVTVR